MFNPITDEDIAKAEEFLLPAGEHFDEQRRNIIKCQDSVDVNACPGSGKTTVMLAKLLLLSSQLPIKSNGGICVLTHTNVAIDEIKEKLGLSDTVLFKYPNHFGTIQSFVNKFLAIPGYSVMFPHRRPSIIDQEWYNSVIAKRYPSWHGAGKTWIQHKPDPVPLLQSYRFNSQFNNLLKKMKGDPVFNNNGPALQNIFDFKMRILREGILSFDDAYLLAEFYITKYPKIKELLTKRFPLVIIDEMQDTDENQLALLNLIFDPASTVVQRIGDYNQAIYNKVTEQSVWNIGINTLPLSDSRRFSNGIAQQIDRICVTPRNMNGNAAIADIPSRIILFPQQRINDVIPHFGNLLIEANIPSLSKKPAKVVGWVKETEAAAGQVRNCIQAYWASYSLVNRVTRKDFPNLDEYLVKPEAAIIETKGTSYYWDVALQILLKSLRILNVRHDSGSYYSKTSLISKLKLHPAFFELFQVGIIQWIHQIHLNQNPFVAIRTFVIDQFLPLFNLVPDAELNAFLNNQNPPSIVVAANQQDAGNIFKHSYGGIDPCHADKQVEIPVCTIHSVKGETHSATLYLETFYFEEDIKKIRRYLKIGAGAGIPTTQVRMIQTLKMAYVAMSRPIHLLCLAIRNDGITQQDIDELQAVGWTVDDTLCH